ncbi:MAG TPA: Bax inhibitor-1/YccA family protein [Kiloniellales bacterium]|mgnify:CR=1 FL=1|jgi:FtsH-binding integral membrane protein|nr:Bax inhibitor-1/YccA family protein [Kiloniellales bacterium]
MAFGPNRTRYMTGSEAQVAQLDEGLRSYMLRVYNYMGLGVAFTGAIAMMVASNEALVQGVASMFWLFFIGILGLGFLAPRIMTTKSTGAAQICFWVYAGLWGALLGPMMYAYAAIDPMLIARAFFITAGTFAGMSLLGYTTKKNLAPMGAFLAMATIGILIALLINAFFIQDSGFQLLLSIVVVLVFSGLTAYETQQIKNMYIETDGADVATKKAIFGAFMLYGSFITLFIYILHILGMMRE